ncbi:ATP synthase delta chain, chloroplastic [Lycium barbarum]|uniref:ATP synthase delta chain, chloroplastic n=1 Tax=Lycium barbarum TaxID=112863 RepID=UPI00293EF45F|nr:ATP synthase delta chain, chloroplastic [Lycium barbarum]
MDTLSTSVSSLKVPRIHRKSADFYNFKNPYVPPSSSSSHFNFPKPTSLTSNKTNSLYNKKTCNFPTNTFPSLSKNPPLKQPSLRHHQTTHTRASSGYATALIDIAKCNNSLENLEKDVSRLSRWLRNEHLSAIMTDPFVENKEKGYVLEEILSKGKFNKYLVSVVKLLVEKNKVGIVDEVLMEFERIYDQLCGTQVVLVSSEVKMEKNEIFGIAKKVQEFSGAEKVKVKVSNLVHDKKRSRSFAM